MQLESYKTIAQLGINEFTERKSRFIGAVKPVSTEDEAVTFIEEKKTEYWQATHNCWAYIIREPVAQRYSDDGEPQGTAGIPILEVMKKEEIYNAVIVVTRFYGGVQLGAGGLIRAYSQGAKIALDAGKIVVMANCILSEITLPYPLYDRFLSLTEDFPMTTIDTTFTEDVTLEIRLRSDYQPRLEKILTELSAGEISPKVTGEVFAPV